MAKPLAFIVEDDPQLSQLFSLALKEYFETRVFRDGTQVLRQVALMRPTLVILDLHLPGVSGEQLLHSIRADSQLSQIHIILVTADALMANLLDEETNIVLLKPVSPMQLRELSLKFISS
jgi:DNA-binding response OmpR family regulator